MGTVSVENEPNYSGGLTYNSATAQAVSGYSFIGWYDQDGNIVSSEQTFNVTGASSSMLLTARFRKSGQARIRVTVNNASYGDVRYNNDSDSYLGDRNTNEDGTLHNTISARPNAGFDFLYWTVNGNPVTNFGPTIGPNTYPKLYLSAGDKLQAVFVPTNTVDANGNAVSDIVITGEKKAELQRWLNSLKNNSSAAADKTAHVFDYQNRVYEIDFDVASSLMNLNAQIDLAFIIDVSNSMLFPANLVKDHDPIILTQGNLNDIYPDGGTYYIISDPLRTSTVYRIFRDTDGIWYYVDASYNDSYKAKIEWNRRYAEPYTIEVPFSYPI